MFRHAIYTCPSRCSLFVLEGRSNVKLRGGLPPRGRDKEGGGEEGGEKRKDGEKPEKREEGEGEEEAEDQAEDSGRRR